MFKKALKIAVTFGLLVGAYLGYTYLFAIVTDRLVEDREDVGIQFAKNESDSAQRATELAREQFGPDFFASKGDLKLRYYEAARGIYMYAENKRLLNGNKRIELWPFAMIWISKDGKSHKTATSDSAIIDLSQPFMDVKPSSDPTRVSHAKMIGEVRLRDDKGTRDDPTDDLRVGPMAAVEFDDATLQITTELDAEVLLQDRDLTLTGLGLMIQLRRKVGPADPSAGGVTPSGFDAETAHVYRDVHIIVNNVTSDGVLPGTSKSNKGGKVPIDVRSDREMRIDLPKPRPPVLVGPPHLNRLPDPTFVKFNTKVRVIRGNDKTDQLDCDTLDLTLLPDPRPPEDESTRDGEPAKAEGPLTELKIRTALARGHAVWLQSEAQGMIARCVELKYEKHAFENKPDITYLTGGGGKPLMVEKVDYDTKSPVPGTIKSIMKLLAVDATIFEAGGGSSTSKVIARGPGRTEERPARNASVARTVWFEDEMEMLTWRDGEGPAPTPSPLAVRALSQTRPEVPRGTLRRLLTLSGVSKLVDHNTATTLDARKSIVAEFQSDPNPAPAKGDGPAQIKWLDAYEDAHLTAPSKALTARVFLKAKFEQPEPVAPMPTPAPGAVAAGPAPVIVAASPSPGPSPINLEAKPEPEPEPKALPAEPLVDGRADRVWASVQLGGEGAGMANTKGELKNAQLRGDVMVHQDPAPGKLQGSDASGQALDLTAQENGLMKFVVKREEPQAFDSKTRLASSGRGRPTALALPMARVETEGKTIESDDIIGIDQKLDFLWVQGSGLFTQMTDRGLLDDKGIEGEKPPIDPKAALTVRVKPVGPSPQDRLAVSWNREMRFYGRSVDLEGRTVAKIEFRGESMDVRTPDGRREYRRGVEAKMTDSAIFTDTMDVYMDRTIAFNKEARQPAADPDNPKPPDPQIAMLDCKGKDIVEDAKLKWPGVDVQSRKFDLKTGEFQEKQRIQGQHVLYDKRTGNFYGYGAGTAWIYRRKKDDASNSSPIPTAFPVGLSPNTPGRAEVVVGDKKRVPLELTKIKFTDGMRGRFGVAKDRVEVERREAEFVGSVQTAHASVWKDNSDIDFDHVEKWTDSVFLTSDVLNVFSIPLPAGSKPADRQLLNARGNALAKHQYDAVQADRITYDSSTSLTYAYGEDDKEVSITQQDSPGQMPSVGRGKMARYNNKTRESDLKDPQALSFTDLKTGLRAKSFFPDLGGSIKFPDPKPLPRTPLQRQGRVSTERSGFNGH